MRSSTGNIKNLVLDQTLVEVAVNFLNQNVTLCLTKSHSVQFWDETGVFRHENCFASLL